MKKIYSIIFSIILSLLLFTTTVFGNEVLENKCYNKKEFDDVTKNISLLSLLQYTQNNQEVELMLSNDSSIYEVSVDKETICVKQHFTNVIFNQNAVDILHSISEKVKRNSKPI